MKYLDENITLTVTGITTPTAGTYQYVVRDRNSNAIFNGNTFMNSGETTHTFDVTDILVNYKWQSNIKKPIPSSSSVSVNVVNRYYLTLTVSANTYSSETIDVAFVYRYPNRKNALEPSLFDSGTTTGVTFQNCLQGAKNGLCELYPHIPYKYTDEYGFASVFEIASGGSFVNMIWAANSFDGQLYIDNPSSTPRLGITGAVTCTLNKWFTGATEAHICQPSYTLSGFTKETEIDDRDIFYAEDDAEEPSRYIYVWTPDRQIGTYLVSDRVNSFDLKMTNADAHSIFITGERQTGKYIQLFNMDFIDNVHVQIESWIGGNGYLYIEAITSKGDINADVTHLNLNIPNQLIGKEVRADGLKPNVPIYDVYTYMLGKLHLPKDTAELSCADLQEAVDTFIYSGSLDEVNAVLPDLNNMLTDVYTVPIYGTRPEHIAIVDKGCLSKYYLLWQDRYGGYQSQPFSKTDTFSIDYQYEEMKTYQNFRRNITINAQPKWKIRTDWIDEKYYPYYESIFVSPYLLLYDTEEDKSYNVIVKDTNFTEKTWKNQHKFFNMELELEQTKQQNILY